MPTYSRFRRLSRYSHKVRSNPSVPSNGSTYRLLANRDPPSFAFLCSSLRTRSCFENAYTFLPVDRTEILPRYTSFYNRVASVLLTGDLIGTGPHNDILPRACFNAARNARSLFGRIFVMRDDICTSDKSKAKACQSNVITRNARARVTTDFNA